VALEEGLAGGTVGSDGTTEANGTAEPVQAGKPDDAGESAEAEAAAVNAEDAVPEAEPEAEAGPGDGDPDDTAGADEPPEAAAPTAVTKALPIIEPVAESEPVAEPEPAEPPVAEPEPVAAAQPIAAAEGGRRRVSWKIATAVGAAAAILIASVVVAATSSTAASPKASHHKKVKAEALSLVSVSPSNGATSVNGAAPITVTYSGPITTSTPLPTLSPDIPGSWQVSKDKAIFTPQVGFRQNTHVTVNVPAPAGTAMTTTAATTYSFTTGQYSMLRMDQLLSQLGYIPVSWTPADPSGDIPATDANAQLSAAYDPPAGTFTFDSGYPPALTRQWSVGTSNEITDGAIRTFEFDHNLNMDGVAGPHVWQHMFTAIARGQQNQHGYTYVWVTQAGTEHLKLYHNGHVAITSPVNTGIAGRSTADGTFPVYLRYTVTQMQGTNPNGTPYNDTVYWVSYFNGGDAVHAFPRGGYGWYQSLGCVELPYDGSGPGVAENVWNLITYGTLVTVVGPVA
jgi:hypothetical protein